MPISKVSQAGLSSGAQFNTFKNRIINGAMVIDQRNAGASVTATTANLYSVDRWQAVASQSSKYTIQRNAGSVTPPVGFINYLGVTSSSAYSVLSSDYFSIQQIVEGLNITDFAWGTVSASSVTLSFWVRSSLTGTFGGVLKNAGGTRSYPFSYTISSANTWEQKFITVPGDTTGTWLTTNDQGILVNFGLGTGSTYTAAAGAWTAANIVQPTGSVSVVGTNGATFYITGVQLEKGSTATSFDYRPYGTELQLCQRYYYKYSSGGVTLGVYRTDTGLKAMTFNLNQPMRSSPTVTISATGGAGTFSANPQNNDSIEFTVSGASLTSRTYITDFDSAAEL
jgi:hypothetical protein